MACWIMEINGRVLRIARREFQTLDKEIEKIEEATNVFLKSKAVNDGGVSYFEFSKVEGLTPIHLEKIAKKR